MIRCSFALTTIAAMYFLAADPAQAQATAEPVHEAMPSVSDYWSDLNRKIVVVLLKDPGVRHTCRVQGFRTDRLYCAHRFHSQPTMYRAEELEALIGPPAVIRPWLPFAGFLGTGAAVITGACFLASLTVVGAIPVAIVGGMTVLASPLVITHDYQKHDVLLYQRAGTTLAIKLR